MLVEEGDKTHGRWRNALCGAGVTQQHGEDTRASPGMSSGTRVGGKVGPTLPSLLPGMCQQLQLFHTLLQTGTGVALPAGTCSCLEGFGQRRAGTEQDREGGTCSGGGTDVRSSLNQAG